MTFPIGTVFHGYCGGAFGRDDWNCKRLTENCGDYLILRRVKDGQPELVYPQDLTPDLAEYTQPQPIEGYPGEYQCNCESEL